MRDAHDTPPIKDLQTLRAMTHPLRWTLYELLLVHGPSTAARLGETVGMTSSHVSYHLKQLAKNGYIEPDAPAGRDKREKWWRAIEGGIHWNSPEFSDTEVGRAAESEISAFMLHRQEQRLKSWWDRSPNESAEWRSASLSVDSITRLTVTELQKMTDEIQEVISRWSRLGRERIITNEAMRESLRQVFIFTHVFPE